MHQKAYWNQDIRLKREIEKNLDVMNHWLCVQVFRISRQPTLNGTLLLIQKHPLHFLILHLLLFVLYMSMACLWIPRLGEHTVHSARQLFVLEHPWTLSQYLGFCCVTQQLAHRLVTPHVVFSSLVRTPSSENASPSLCCPRQAWTGTAALPVLICIPLVLQSSSLSRLFSFFSSMNKHLQAHRYCQAVLRVITLLCRFTCGSPDSPNVSAWVCRMFRHVPILRCKFTLT